MFLGETFSFRHPRRGVLLVAVRPRFISAYQLMTVDFLWITLTVIVH